MRACRISRIVIAAGFLSLLAGCGSGDAIVLDGFSFEELSENRFSVRFESEGLSEVGAIRNLNFHTARLTLDQGASYYALDSMEADRTASREVEHSSSDSSEADAGSTPIATGSETTTRYSSTVTIGRKTIITAIATIYRDRPEGIRVTDAARMLEELGGSSQ